MCIKQGQSSNKLTGLQAVGTWPARAAEVGQNPTLWVQDMGEAGDARGWYAQRNAGVAPTITRRNAPPPEAAVPARPPTPRLRRIQKSDDCRCPRDL
jgi:hypothetical protein